MYCMRLSLMTTTFCPTSITCPFFTTIFAGMGKRIFCCIIVLINSLFWSIQRTLTLTEKLYHSVEFKWQTYLNMNLQSKGKTFTRRFLRLKSFRKYKKQSKNITKKRLNREKRIKRGKSVRQLNSKAKLFSKCKATNRVLNST